MEEPTEGVIDAWKIWDQAPHNAFGDFFRFQDRWYSTFREGQSHHYGLPEYNDGGAIRVIVSEDAKQWSSAALIKPEPGHDLRDPHLEKMPDGRLMMLAVDVERDDRERSDFVFQTMARFSSDGKDWGEANPVGELNMWLWRVTWYAGIAYGVGYSTGDNGFTRLYKSSDGIHFEVLVDKLFEAGYSNESAIVFDDEGTAFCLLRRDWKPDDSAQLGIARPPYTDWTWKDLGLRLGGPDMIRLSDGRLVAAGRIYNARSKYRLQFPWRTSLLWVDPEQGTMTEFQKLPSGADNSYPGLVLHDGLLWVGYYTGHEDSRDLYHLERQTNIWVAKVKLPALSSQ